MFKKCAVKNKNRKKVMINSIHFEYHSQAHLFPTWILKSIVWRIYKLIPCNKLQASKDYILKKIVEKQSVFFCFNLCFSAIIFARVLFLFILKHTLLMFYLFVIMIIIFFLPFEDIIRRIHNARLATLNCIETAVMQKMIVRQSHHQSF